MFFYDERTTPTAEDSAQAIATHVALNRSSYPMFVFSEYDVHRLKEPITAKLKDVG